MPLVLWHFKLAESLGIVSYLSTILYRQLEYQKMDGPSIFIFTLFMITGFAFTLISGMALMIPVKRMISRKKIPNDYVNLIIILSTLVSTVFIPLLSKIMTGNSYVLLFIAMFVTMIVSIGIGSTVARTLGHNKVRWYSRSIWSEAEIQVRHIGLSFISAVISKGTIYLYPFVIGYGYFGGIYPTPEWPNFFLHSTIVLLFILPFIAELPKITITLSNKNITTYQRSRILINHLFVSLQLFLLVAFLLWNIGWQGKSIELLSGNIVISSTSFATFAGYYLLFFFIPYMEGQRRARVWCTQLEQRRQAIIEQSQTALNADNRNKTLATLSALIRKCQQELDSILQLEAIKLARELLESEQDEKNLQQIAIRDASPRDPRFRHISFMKQAQQTLQEHHNLLLNPDVNQDTHQSSAELCRKLEQALPPMIDRTNHWKAMLASVIIGIALNVVASTVGHTIAEQLS